MKKETELSALFVLPTDAIGGAERVAMNLAYHLSSVHKYEHIYIYILCKGNKAGGWKYLETFKNVSIIYNDYKNEKTSLLPFVLYLLKKNIKYEVVYSTHTHVNSLLSLLKKSYLIRANFLIARESTVITDRFSGLKSYIYSFLYKLYGSHDLLICQTKYMKKELVRSRGSRIAKKIEVIQNPINVKYLASHNLSEMYSGRNTIVIVGRLVEIKNHILLLEVIKNLRNDSVIGDEFRLNIVGDGPMLSCLKGYVIANDIEKYVAFLGHVESPYSLMNGADIGVVTSLKEGFPNVILEMMASGTKYIITTPCAGDLGELNLVRVLPDFDESTLYGEIVNALQYKYDFSEKYYRQVIERDVSVFWKKIEDLCHESK